MYELSDERFFSLDSTKDALESLATSDRLVVYCGAGVTIDQTGLSWESMLATAFGKEPAELEGLQRWATFPEIASALAEASTGAPPGQVGRRLQQHFYGEKEMVWSGDLVDRIALLVSAAATAGKHVTVVTTNYDDFIQRRLRRKLAQERKGAAERGKPGPGVVVRVHDMAGECAPAPIPGRVDIYHLHGRVPREHRKGTPLPNLVLTEPHYTASRKFTAPFLADVLEPGAGLLIVGSSLHDQPLVDALIGTRGRGAGRYALWALEPTEMYRSDRCLDYLRFLRLRAQHIGVRLLTPHLLYQVPQFCLELARAISAEEGAHRYVIGPDRYGARLTSWWQQFSAARYSEPHPLYQRLANRQALVRALLSGPRADSEQFRLDLWVRTDPATRRDLTLVASSVGPMLEQSAYKSRPLGLGSGHATVTGFTRGRPTVFGREDLGMAFDSRARWKTFLVVPVAAVVAGVKTPVGAVTLCSSSEKRASSLNRIPRQDLRRIVALLQDVLPSSGA